MTINANFIRKTHSEPAQSEGLFALHESTKLKQNQSQLTNDHLQELKFAVAKNPQGLTAHIQRIYSCFQLEHSEHLYAALVDLLVVLNRQGKKISWRMIGGAREKLPPEQFKILLNYLQHPQMNKDLLPGNPHSLFSKGLIGTNQFITKQADLSQPDIDVMTVARDFITYNQLSQAQAILEQAIIDQPDRADLQQELLELYFSLDNAVDFKRMRSKLINLKLPLVNEWQQLSGHFDGLKCHE